MASLDETMNILTGFSDSEKFRRNESGDIVFNTNRSTWADILMDGMPIDAHMNATVGGVHKYNSRMMTTCVYKRTHKEAVVTTPMTKKHRQRRSMPTRRRAEKGDQATKSFNQKKLHKQGRLSMTHVSNWDDIPVCGIEGCTNETTESVCSVCSNLATDRQNLANLKHSQRCCTGCCYLWAIFADGHYDDTGVISSRETVGHDGYDRYGPESDLFDFYITYRENGVVKTDQWHREDWFRGVPEEYQLWKKDVTIRPQTLNYFWGKKKKPIRRKNSAKTW